jgi:hypothetical protein
VVSRSIWLQAFAVSICVNIGKQIKSVVSSPHDPYFVVQMVSKSSFIACCLPVR